MRFSAFKIVLSGFAGATVIAGAGAASAAPATYRMVVDGVQASMNGTAVGPNAVVTITINGDTTAVVPQTIGGGPGNCVTGSGTIEVSGGATAAFVSGAAYICARVDGQQVGFYPTPIEADFGNPIHGGNGGNGTGALVGAPFGAPGITLTDNFGPVSYQTNTIHSHGAAVALTGGGTYLGFSPEGGPNSAVSVFEVQLAAAPAPVPTLSEWAMILFGLILAGGAAVMIQRRRFTA